MERIGILINKLKEQYEQHADAVQLQITLQMLQSELLQQQAKGYSNLSSSKVSVTMPKSMQGHFTRGEFEEKPVDNPITSVSHQVKLPIHETPAIKYEEKPAAVAVKPQMDMAFEIPAVDIPTLAHQPGGAKEINDTVAAGNKSLNDKLGSGNTELGETLKESPIKDLRKAIGINDRFVFVNELFRGDEAMYERSIKTINAFAIYPEAEYWINRELKVKIGWNENKEAVQHFYQLVKRRFT
jgi:hypothetical protein